MVSFRGLLLSAGAGVLAVVGLGFGVEEFVMLAIALGVLLVLGAISVLWRTRTTRRSLRLDLEVPAVEVSVGQLATMELHVTNAGRRTVAPFRLEAPARRWTVSYPGLGARQPGAPPDPTPAATEGNPLAGPGPHPGRLGPHRRPPPGIGHRRPHPGPDGHPRGPHPPSRRRLVRGPLPSLRPPGRRGPLGLCDRLSRPRPDPGTRLTSPTVVSGRPSEPRPGAPPRRPRWPGTISPRSVPTSPAIA